MEEWERQLAEQRARQERSEYNDGCTDGRTFCRTHSAAERAAEAERVAPFAAAGQRYYDGYLSILDAWIDGQGA